MGRRGRRPGTSGTREDILEAARELFAARGYERTTIREVARRAAVNPALVYHYFGSKRLLFTATIELDLQTAAVVPAVLADDGAKVVEHLVRAFTAAWESGERRSAFVSLVRAAASDEEAASMLREVVASSAVAPVTAALHTSDAGLRANLVAAHMIGLAVARYVVRLEPIASTPIDEVMHAVAPTVRRYLVGDLKESA